MTETGFAEYFRAQDGDCTDLFENFSENSLKGVLSNDTTLTPPVLFKYIALHIVCGNIIQILLELFFVVSLLT